MNNAELIYAKYDEAKNQMIRVFIEGRYLNLEINGKLTNRIVF